MAGLSIQVDLSNSSMGTPEISSNILKTLSKNVLKTFSKNVQFRQKLEVAIEVFK